MTVAAAVQLGTLLIVAGLTVAADCQSHIRELPDDWVQYNDMSLADWLGRKQLAADSTQRTQHYQGAYEHMEPSD